MKKSCVFILLLIMLISIVFVACDSNVQQINDTIEFHSNFGDDSISYTPNSSFTREGYTFIGWSYEKDGEIVKYEDIKANAVVYAQWKINEYTVKFYVGINLVYETTVNYLEAANEPTEEEITPYLDGKEFVSWDKPFDKVKSNLSVNAVLQEKTIKHAVSFIQNNETIKEYKLAENSTINLSIVPQIEKGGFTFEKWIDENGNELTDSYIVSNDVVFSPVYSLATPINPTIKSDKSSYTYGDNISITATNNYVYDDIDYTYSWSSKYDTASLNQNDFENKLSFTSTPAYVGEITYFLTTTATYLDETKTNTSFIKVNIKKADLIVSIGDNISLSYGDDLPNTYSVDVKGYKLDDDYNSLNGIIAYKTNYSNISIPGPYDIEISGLSSDFYNIQYVTKTFDVSKKIISIEDSLEKTYDTQAITSSCSSSISNGATYTCTYSTNSANAGSYSYNNGNIVANFSAFLGKTNVTSCFEVIYNIDAEILPATIIYTKIDDINGDFNTTSYGSTVSVETANCIIEYSLNNIDFTKEKIEKKDAGEYTVYYRISKDNYTTINDSFKINISPANISINIDDKEITYGDACNNYSSSISGSLYGYEISYVYNSNYTIGNNVGVYDISITLNNEYPNFNIDVNKGKLVVNKRHINVAINNSNVIYGEDIATADFTTSNMYENDKKDEIITITSTYKKGDTVISTNKFSASLNQNNSNYVIDNVTGGEITVIKRNISIDVCDNEIEYGNSFDANLCQYTTVSGSLFGNDVLAVSYSCSYEQYNKAGLTFDITANASILNNNEDYSYNYQIKLTKGTLKVIPRKISILVGDQNIIYGNLFEPTRCSYSVTSGSIVNNDNLALSYSCLYTIGDPIDSYEIFAESNNENYNVSITPGALKVGKKSITIKVHETKAQNGKPYSKAFDNEFTSNLFANDRISGTITPKQNGTLIENGTYTSNELFSFNLSILNSNNEDRTNCYECTYDMNIIIKHVPIEYTASGVTCIYDGNYHNGSLVVTEENLNNLSVTYSLDKINYSNEMPSFKNAGEYTVYYLITAEDKTPTEFYFDVVIEKVQIIISANPKSIFYGDSLTELTYSITSGSFVKGEESLTDSIKLNCDYSQGNSIGTYPITFTIEKLANYEISTISANLTVNKRVINISILDNSMIYGEQYTNPQYIATNLYNDDTSFIIISVENYSDLLNVGQYKYTAITTNSNYELSINSAYLTVEKRIASIKAKDITISYGDVAVFESEITNLLENEVVTYSCEYSNAGSYTITPIFENSNYDLTITTATLTVNKANLTISINVPTTTINYGDDCPIYTVKSYDGFKNNETESVLEGTFNYHCDYLDQKKAGTYNINFFGLSSINYNIIYPEVSCVVNKVQLTFSIEEVAPITYLDPEPEYTYTVSGYVNGDDSSSFSGVSIYAAYKQNDNASSSGYAYYVDISNAVSDNYTFTTNGIIKYLVVNKYTPQNITCSSINGIVYSPTATLSTYGSLLPQHFSWVNPETKPVCAISSYEAVYNPNPINYNDVIVSVPMEVAKANSTISYSSQETNYTGSEIDYISIINASTNNTDNTAIDYQIAESIMKDGGKYSVKLSVFETANYNECIVNIIFSVKAALIGSTYYTVEDAITTGGNIVILGNSFVSPGTYNLSSGSSITLYYDDANTTLNSYNTTKTEYFIDYYESTYLKKRLTLKTGTTLNVYGSINIGGITTSPSQILNGHTSGDYTQIDVEPNSSIIVKSGGTISCYGYIKGDGATIYESGATAYYPFIVRDFKGGTNTAALYNEKSSPFEQYEVANNQTYQTIYCGSTINAYCVLYANDKHNSTTATYIAQSGALFNLTSGRIDLHVVPQSKDKNAITISYYKFNGQVSLGNLSLKVSLGVSITVNTNTVLFPFSYLYNMTIESGTFTAANKMQLLTGNIFTINPGAELIINADFMIRSSDYTNPDTLPFWYPKGLAPAKLINNGKITIGNVKIGGRVCSTLSGSTITTGSFTHGISTIICNGKRVATIFVKPDVSYTITEANFLLITASGKDADATTASASSSYTYDGTNWILG